MGMLRILSKRGDDRVNWDNRRVTVGDSEAEAAVREAERIFKEQRAKGATAFRVDADGTTRIDEFDAKAEQIVMVPRVIGG